MFNIYHPEMFGYVSECFFFNQVMLFGLGYSRVTAGAELIGCCYAARLLDTYHLHRHHSMDGDDMSGFFSLLDLYVLGNLVGFFFFF